MAIVRWAAGMGAVTAEAVAVHLGVSAASARGRLRAAEAERLLKRCRPLTGHPALYTVTRPVCGRPKYEVSTHAR